MTSDTELIDRLLREARSDVEQWVDYGRFLPDAELNAKVQQAHVNLARINAEIARRIPQQMDDVVRRWLVRHGVIA